MRRTLPVLAVPAVLILFLFGLDLAREPGPADPVEIGLDLAEKLLLAAMMVAVAWAMLRINGLREDHRALLDHLERATAQGQDWRAARAEEISALGGAIAQQFRDWGLSPAEIDVAGLLLKGASMKEIALARDTSEATIRQQAQSLYRKAGLSGRVELSAYFLDSLFIAAEDRRDRRLRAVDS